MNRNELKPEWQLVLLGSVELDGAKACEFEALLDNPVNWADIIFQLVTHRSLNMFYYNLQKSGRFSKLEKELQRLFDTQWFVYGERNRYYLSKLTEILREFEKYNLVVPILKGNLLASLVYPAIETRIFNDLDLLMKIEDVAPVTQALEGIGYIQGHYDEETKTIVAATRKEKMLQQMASHELQEFQKLGDSSFAKLIQADVNHDILWKGNCPYKIPTQDLIGRAITVKIDGAKGYMLDYIDNIIQLSCHLYKEATLMMWISDLRDLKIYKFADLHMYIKKFSHQIDWNLLIERTKGYQIEKIIYYNFHYIGLMFGDIVPRHVLDSIRPADLSYLDEYGIENQTPSRWEFDFFTRLFDTNRVLKLSEEQCKNMAKFIDAKVESDGVMIHRKSSE
jgi:hypothetical protein